MYSLNKLTCQKSASGSITSAPAWDDLIGMRLDAGQVIEARAKEVQYVKGTGVYTKIPRREAQAKGWKVIKHDGSTSTKVMIEIPCIEVGW